MIWTYLGWVIVVLYAFSAIVGIVILDLVAILTIYNLLQC